MSYAPKPLRDARAYLLGELDARPGVARHADLEPDEVGIVGNLATHFVGYHLGWDRILGNLGRRDYSVSESRRDADPTDGASALDIGQFDVRRGRRRLTLPDMSLWIVRECKAGAPDTRDIREVIYSPDGRVVRRWDRLGIRDSGDLSHLGHTHLSYFRDSEHRDKTSLFRRYVEGDDMPTADEVADKVIDKLLRLKVTSRVSGNEVPLVHTVLGLTYKRADELLDIVGDLEGQMAGLTTLVEQLTAAGPVHLTPESAQLLATAVREAGAAAGERLLARIEAAGEALTEDPEPA